MRSVLGVAWSSLLILSAVAPISVRPAAASMIGLYFDSQGTTVEKTQPAPETSTLWILVHLGGDSAAVGITGAEFRLDNFPHDWFVTQVPNSAASAVGDLLHGGVSLAFRSCQTSPSQAPVLLYTLHYLATSVVNRHVLRIMESSTASDLALACPTLVLCGGPTPARICVTGSRAAFNYPGFDLAVERGSWSGVKALYK